jgi:hypothetical protein
MLGVMNRSSGTPFKSCGARPSSKNQDGDHVLAKALGTDK